MLPLTYYAFGTKSVQGHLPEGVAVLMTNFLLAVIILLLLKILYNQRPPRQQQESAGGRPRGIIEWSLVIGWIVFVVWACSLAYVHWIR